MYVNTLAVANNILLFLIVSTQAVANAWRASGRLPKSTLTVVSGHAAVVGNMQS